MKHIKKALIDTLILSGLLLIIAVFQESSGTIYGTLIPITAIAGYNFIKAAFRIYIDKKNSVLN